MTHSVSTVAIALTLVAIAACTNSPDPGVVQSLTDGYWHGSLGSYDFIYELGLADGKLGGAAHKIEDGRQLTEIPIVDVSLDGRTIEFDFGPIPAYRGQVDLKSGRITGGHPDAPAYREMNLTKVAQEDWPMVSATSAPPSGESVYAWTRPMDRGDGWKTGMPADVGLDPAAIDGFVGAIQAGEAGAMHSLLVIRDGTMVVEEYFHGWEADDLHRIASCTKSLSSLLVGIAIDRGEIDGVDVPLLDFFPERRRAAGQGWEKIRLEHLLTMSMGLDWTNREADAFTPPGKDRFVEVIGRDVENEPGRSWRYVSRDTNLLSAVILASTGSQADIFAADHVFRPLGITSWDWENNKYEGHPGMGGTLKMRPRDMAKLGQLVLDEGIWNGRQVVSPEWIRESTRSRFSPAPGKEYGYLWWGFEEPPSGGVDFAMGLGSQYIAVAPELRLVVVTTGGNDYNDKQTAFFDVAERYLLPSFAR